jgi:hypothetical protein
MAGRAVKLDLPVGVRMLMAQLRVVHLKNSLAVEQRYVGER